MSLVRPSCRLCKLIWESNSLSFKVKDVTSFLSSRILSFSIASLFCLFTISKYFDSVCLRALTNLSCWTSSCRRLLLEYSDSSRSFSATFSLLVSSWILKSSCLPNYKEYNFLPACEFIAEPDKIIFLGMLQSFDMAFEVVDFQLLLLHSNFCILDFLFLLLHLEAHLVDSLSLLDQQLFKFFNLLNQVNIFVQRTALSLVPETSSRVFFPRAWGSVLVGILRLP